MEVTGHVDSVMYLWNVHNQVNARLRGEEESGDSFSGDPQFPKEPWPMKEMCEDCHNADSSIDDPDFDEFDTYTFLDRYYFWDGSLGKDSRCGILDKKACMKARDCRMVKGQGCDESGVILSGGWDEDNIRDERDLAKCLGVKGKKLAAAPCEEANIARWVLVDGKVCPSLPADASKKDF